MEPTATACLTPASPSAPRSPRGRGFGPPASAHASPRHSSASDDAPVADEPDELQVRAVRESKQSTLLACIDQLPDDEAALTRRGQIDMASPFGQACNEATTTTTGSAKHRVSHASSGAIKRRKKLVDYDDSDDEDGPDDRAPPLLAARSVTMCPGQAAAAASLQALPVNQEAPFGESRLPSATLAPAPSLLAGALLVLAAPYGRDIAESTSASEQQRQCIPVPSFAHVERAANRQKLFSKRVQPVLEGLDVVATMMSPAIYHTMMLRALSALKHHPKRIWKALVQFLRDQARSRGLHA